MSTQGSGDKKDREDEGIVPRRFDNMFDNFRSEMERMMVRPWAFPREWNLPSMFEARDMRTALYELTDRGDRYEVLAELPGIEKEKVDIKATKYMVEISAKHSEKTEEKNKKYVYSERLFRSFYRSIPLPEEIVPSKVTAKMENGMLKVDLPKKAPTKAESESTKIEVK